MDLLGIRAFSRLFFSLLGLLIVLRYILKMVVLI